MSKPSSSIGKISLSIGITSLIVSSFFAGKKIADKNMSATDILKKVKKQFKKEGPIEGSWIESSLINYRNFAFETAAYKGGISRYEDNELVTYEFLADAQTGTVLKISRV